MSRSGIWERFFDGHAPHYMENGFTAATLEEVAFLTETLGLREGHTVLDVGCGTGRHSVELARRGMRVTGADISQGMLNQAGKAARLAGVEVAWIKTDASVELPAGPFDAVICLCEGAFGLVGAGEDPEAHDSAILRNVRAALRPGGQFLLTTLNGLASIREATSEDVVAGRFDPVTLRRKCLLEGQAGADPLEFVERRYTVPELAAMFSSAGLALRQVWGGTAGRWGKRPIDLDEIEVMLLAQAV